MIANVGRTDMGGARESRRQEGKKGATARKTDTMYGTVVSLADRAEHR